MHPILVAYWPVYESASRKFWFIKYNTPVVLVILQNSVTVWYSISWSNAVLLVNKLFPWYTSGFFPAMHQWRAQAKKKQNDLNKWVLPMTSTASSLCTTSHSCSFSCVSVLVYRCLWHMFVPLPPMKPHITVLQSAEYINSSSSLVCWCQLLCRQFQIRLKLIAALSIMSLEKP